MIFVIQDEDIAYFKTQIDSCADDFSRFSLGKEIDAYNKEIYDFAVKEVALSVNPISSLVDIAEVEQIRKISDTHREISLRTRNALVTWSSVSQFIHTQNKCNQLPRIDIPFTDLDYLIVNIYGANLVKTPIPKLYERRLKKLIDINRELNCFLSNSNTALNKQLNFIFDMISSKRNVNAGIVKAIAPHTKLIRMEFVKYSSLINNLSVVDSDRLIDLILRQYINSLNHNQITATSKLAIHKVQIPLISQKSSSLKLELK